ncbi:hypothetical protein HN011_010784 [Eciton burchellii]|nr:hypothetical protein HN011_010784 [Eciton burchellii]
MICLEAQYFNLNKILLQVIGLWPFETVEQSKPVQLQFTILFSILVSALICQLTTFVTSECPSKIVLKILACAAVFLMLILHYGAFRFNIKMVRDLMKKLHHICKELKDENEIAIIKKYGYIGKRFTVVFTMLAFLVIFSLFVSQIFPIILDIVLPINGSRLRRLHITAEYFLDQEKYFFFILFHMDTAVFISKIALVATGTMFITYLHHTCGMFNIASYRIKHAMEINIQQDINYNIEHLISKKIVCAINIHRQAITLSEVLISNFDRTYFCLTIIAVIALSLNLFQIFKFIESENIIEAIYPVIAVGTVILYMFLANYIGQLVTDHSNQIYAAAYDIQWYMYSLHIQKLILFLLQRAVKSFYLTCGGLFVASFECFATLVKASMSYFTVIYST